MSAAAEPFTGGQQLSAEGLRFAYGARAVLRGLDMQPQPGQLTALLGANGAGKSTLFRCLAGLLRPSAGVVTLGGTHLSQLPAAERLRRICYIPQSYTVGARLTVYETVLLAQQQSGQRFSRQEALAHVEQTLERTGLTELSQVYLTELSGGQQQRVGTAQALSQSPRVLLMDEPTSALDLRYQLETLELLRQFTQEKQITTVVALHDLNLAVRYADWMLLLVGGQLQTQGPARELVTRPELGAVYGVELELTHTAAGVPLVAASLPPRAH